MSVEDILTINEKKIVKWGQGYVVFITPEAKRFNWNDKTIVKVSAVEHKDGTQEIKITSRQKK